MVVIQLTPQDVAECQKVALLKEQEITLGNMKNKYPIPGGVKSYDVHLCGNFGEKALAKYLNVAWGFTAYDPKANDVAGYEVRATYHANGRLLTHDEDKKGLYVLATVNRAKYLVTLWGWSNLKRCNTPNRWADDMPYPCYAMPQTELWPLDMLPETVQYRCAKNR